MAAPDVPPAPPPASAPLTCLVTGATGYVGGRLVPALLAAGHRVRVMSRSPERLRDHPWAADVEVARADAGDPEAVARACQGVDVVYYLIHALGTGPEFEETDRRTATVMAGAVREAGAGRLVYLGGLEPEDEALSPHLRSRAEVAAILLGSGVPTVVLRAAVVLGSGSASFEMLRYLTERLPVMVTPRWVHSRIQPIAIRDVLRYLVACARLPADVHRCFDIGGPDVMNYAEMMQRYAAVAELPRRRILPVPIFTPSLSSHWVGLITPVPAAIARPLVESLRNTVVCREHDIAAYVPDPPEGLLGFDEAVRLAVQRIQDSAVTTRWASASVPGAPSDPLPTDPGWAGGSLYVDDRIRPTAAPPAAVWGVIEGIGGERGWYSWPLAWRVRGWLDRVVGGVGLRRGRRDPNRLYVGDALDFWRVEELEQGRLLRLRAEMRLPGLAWLEFHVEHDPVTGGALVRQRATFAPRGLVGHLYWWAVAAFHGFVFGGMLRGIARAAERRD
ncbi:SDR family oxidoreductase [Blastococcus saxobsidens]|uniref:NAD-dependent epimerase/dehydratase n=1 Tax=Blastococcus saxobsidens (strain DD2) TaxID=1146883 RepID=H6RJA4_BLASD|nr:SDR family oxidoreductase [Blastococcus saxobsidens]CCG01017.1 NAD-dependent epimerase/dehydratase [Blastococcus saxobsidens DD2]